MSKTISAGHIKPHFTFPVTIKSLEPRPQLTAHRLVNYIERLGAGGNRMQWMGITMLLQSIVITPTVAIFIMLTANWTPLWFIATASMYATFMPSLAGLHVKWIRFVFIINFFVSLLIVLAAVVHMIFS